MRIAGKRREGAMKKKVLIVDDAAFMRMKIKRVLEPLDCELLEASNGQEGCMQFTSQPVDLVILDISMPVMNGLEALKEMMRINNEVPVVMCSAIGQESQIVKAVQCGAREFIIKPFADEQLRKVVKNILHL